MTEKNWTIRKTDERAALVAEVRRLLSISKRPVETIYDTPTFAGMIDEGLKALKRELSAEINGGKD